MQVRPPAPLRGFGRVKILPPQQRCRFARLRPYGASDG